MEQCVLPVFMKTLQQNKWVVHIHMIADDVERVPIDGSSRLGFFQVRVTVLPVMDSITGAPSGGSGRTSAKETRGKILGRTHINPDMCSIPQIKWQSYILERGYRDDQPVDFSVLCLVERFGSRTLGRPLILSEIIIRGSRNPAHSGTYVVFASQGHFFAVNLSKYVE